MAGRDSSLRGRPSPRLYWPYEPKAFQRRRCRDSVGSPRSMGRGPDVHQREQQSRRGTSNYGVLGAHRCYPATSAGTQSRMARSGDSYSRRCIGMLGCRGLPCGSLIFNFRLTHYLEFKPACPHGRSAIIEGLPSAFGCNFRGRTGFDRIARSVGGVPWLISGPRKKADHIFNC